ncbi:MAG: aspartate dehydrogenase domain-containing protein [Hyphomicrobiaceae bacterium]
MTQQCATTSVEIAIGGFGNVGRQVVQAIDRRPELGLRVAAVSAHNLAEATRRALELNLDVAVVPANELPDYAKVVVECATYDSFRLIVEPAIRAGAHVICVSAGALGVNLDLLDVAEKSGGTIQIASGALPGLDILRAAREGSIQSVKLTSHILPRSLEHESYVTERNINLEKADVAPVPIFSGNAREAALHFPRHFNVAVALSLAGIGLDSTEIEVFANAQIPGTRHTVNVKSDVGELEMTSQNYPSVENNRTSRIVAPSILAALRELRTPLRVGS